MCGTVHVDELLDSMPPELFDRWLAWHRIHPLDHTPKMLATITIWLGEFIGKDMGTELDDSGTTLIDLLMPWTRKTSTVEKMEQYHKQRGH